MVETQEYISCRSRTVFLDPVGVRFRFRAIVGTENRDRQSRRRVHITIIHRVGELIFQRTFGVVGVIVVIQRLHGRIGVVQRIAVYTILVDGKRSILTGYCGTSSRIFIIRTIENIGYGQ